MLRVTFALLCCLVVRLGFALDARSVGADLFVNEVKIHTFMTPHAGLTPAQRAAAASSNLQKLTQASTFTKVASGKNWLVKMGAATVLIVTPAEAKARRVSAQTLAATVTQRLIDAANQPPLKVVQKTLDIPTDRAGTLTVTGFAASKALATVSAPDVVRVEKTPGGFKVSPLGLGTVQVSVVSGEWKETVAVTVRPYAFTPSGPLWTQVTGDPADKTVVSGAVSALLQAHTPCPPGAKVWAKVSNAGPVSTGMERKVTAKVFATGPGCFPFEGEVTVTVFNIGKGPGREDELWYSNNPESVERPGRLYWGELTEGRSARLLYHHQNDNPLPQVIQYVIVNPTDQPAVVTLNLGESRPDKNPTRAGYVAGESYLAKWLSRSGEVVSVPAGSAVPITVRRLAKGETTSGLASIGLRKGGASRIVVFGDAVFDQRSPSSWIPGREVVGAWHNCRALPVRTLSMRIEGEAKDVYPDPFRDERFEYQIGGKFGVVRIGEKAIPDAAQHRSLDGNFGVIYDIQGSIYNPTPEPAEVELLLEASAGYGSGLFVVNGEWIRLGLISPKREVVLMNIKVPAGATKDLRIQTLPLSGANYPVTLIVRPTGFELASRHQR